VSWWRGRRRDGSRARKLTIIHIKNDERRGIGCAFFICTAIHAYNENAFIAKEYFVTRLISVLLFAICIIVIAIFAMSFAEQLPPTFPHAIDWSNLHIAIQNGSIRYENELGLRVPPWIVLLILPLGFLSMRASWALVALFTMIVLLISVPQTRPRWRYYLAILLLELSFPMLRHTVDGNFEGIVIAGILLALWGYRLGLRPQENRQTEWIAPAFLAAGALLAAAKPQLTAWFLLVFGLTTLYTWQKRRWLRALGFTLLVVVPCMLWKGQAYITNVFAISERGSIMDVSLMAALNRMQLSSILVVMVWLFILVATMWLMWQTRPSRVNPLPFSRERAGLLIAAGLLLSPYSAGNSMLTLLAIGIIPLFLKRPLLGLLLIIPINLTIFVNNPSGLAYQAYYTTAVLLLCWGVLAYRVFNNEKYFRSEHGIPV
jgi:hypothetical protein